MKRIQVQALDHGATLEILPQAKDQNRLEPSFFGFNIEWFEFQRGLWNSHTRSVNPQALDYLRGFSDAIYRFPGGNGANRYLWKEAIGNEDQRPIRRFVDWAEPQKATFGPAEYLKFVGEVQGKAWYTLNVTNLRGLPNSLENQTPIKEVIESLVPIAERYNTRIVGWEVGNELDRNEYRWPPEQLGKVGQIVGKALQRESSDAKLVLSLQEYPTLGRLRYSEREYNQIAAAQVRSYQTDFSMHLYYDAQGESYTVPRALQSLCDAVEHVNGTQSQAARVWVTEHGRVPVGMWGARSKMVWPQTSDLQAAISTADMVIASTRMPEVAGLFIHALHATGGPWPMFHPSANSTELRPSVVLSALSLLRENLYPVVHAGKLSSSNSSGYSGGYDTRMTVLSDESRKNYAIWAVNRSENTLDAWIKNVPLPTRKNGIRHRFLTAEKLTASNAERFEVKTQTQTLALTSLTSDSETLHLRLPPRSINTFSWSTVSP